MVNILTTDAARVFISSTFQDLQAERTFLVEDVFPVLRSSFRKRGIQLAEIDLRWGVTEEESSQARTIGLCLREIDRCRPFFVAIIGDRYGYVPTAEELALAAAQDPFDVLSRASGLSLTEIEIVHGVLDRPKTEVEALFFVRAHQAPITPEDARRLKAMQARISAAGHAIVPFNDARHLGELVSAALSEALNRIYPIVQIEDPYARLARLHDALAKERLSPYVRDETRLVAMDRWIDQQAAKSLMLVGPAGCGKAALAINWLAHRKISHPHDFVFHHFFGASTESGDIRHVLRRLWDAINRCIGEDVPIPTTMLELERRLSSRLTAVSKSIEAEGGTFFIALLGSEKLTYNPRQRWLPTYTPLNIRVIETRRLDPDVARMAGFEVIALDSPPTDLRHQIVEAYLGHFGKRLPTSTIARIATHPNSNDLLTLRSMLEELRQFGSHEELLERIEWYLSADGAASFYSRVLERLEDKFTKRLLGEACLTLLIMEEGMLETDWHAIVRAPMATLLSIQYGLANGVWAEDGRVYLSNPHIKNAIATRFSSEPALMIRQLSAVITYLSTSEWTERSARVLPGLLLLIKDHEELMTIMCAPEKFERLVDRGFDEYLDNWNRVGAEPREVERCVRDVVAAPPGDSWTELDIGRVRKGIAFLTYAGLVSRTSIGLIERLVNAALRTWGEKSPETLSTFTVAGDALCAAGWAGTAVQFYGRTMQGCTELYGNGSPELIEAGRKLCEAFMQARAPQTGDMFRRVFTAASKHLGFDHMETVAVARAMARFEMANGNYLDAERYCRYVTAEYIRQYGGQDSRVSLAMSDHALARTRLGDHSDIDEVAKTNYKLDVVLGNAVGAVELIAKILPEDHPEHLAAKQNLGIIYRLRGSFEDAVGLLTDVHARHKTKYGVDAPRALEVQSELASALADAGRREEALTLFRDEVERSKQVFGEDHWRSEVAARNLTAVSKNAKGSPIGQGSRVRPAPPRGLRSFWQSIFKKPS